ncbi:glycosyltransferase family 4 protein [candidate division KSB1 bacterium]|nr:glycosyltransferase family 4 protein [candidate division KSB1 bacterium]
MKDCAGKVLIIVQNLPVPFDRRVWLEAKTLRDYGLHVSIISPKSKDFSKSFEKIEDIAVYRYKMPIEAHGVPGYFFEFIYAWLATAFLSIRVWFQEGFDVIQACNPPDTYWVLGQIYRLFGVTFIFDHHDLSPEMFDAKYHGKRLLRRGLVWLEKKTLKNATLVLSTNHSYKNIAIERGGKNPQDVYVVRTGPDVQRLQTVRPEPPLKFGKKYLVCYLGEMCPQDGVDLLLKAILYFITKLGRTDTHFVLIGGGPAMPAMRALRDEMGLQQNVTFTGRIPDTDLCRYLSTADVCVDPDPWTEWANHSTMNKILEYMTFGKPIVAFDLDEHKNSAHEAAFYVQPNDTRLFAEAIDELLKNPEKRQAMGRIGYARIRGQLAWTHTHKALVAAYNRLFPEMKSADEAEQHLLDFVLSGIHRKAYTDAENVNILPRDKGKSASSQKAEQISCDSH